MRRRETQGKALATHWSTKDLIGGQSFRPRELSSYAKTARYARRLRRTTFDDARLTRLANRSRERSERLAKVGGHPSHHARLTRPAIRSRERSERLAKDGGEGGIRTHVPFRTTRFRGAPVTTTSVPLRWNFAAICRGPDRSRGTIHYSNPNRSFPPRSGSRPRTSNRSVAP